MSLDHQLKFGVVGGKTGVNSCCPFEQISGRVIWAARSLQGALLNYSVLHGFLSMQHINLLSPSSGRLNLFQVNCFTPSSGCQCSTQLKQIITCKIKTYAPSGHWDQQSTWCRDPKYNVSWRGSTEGHKCTGTLVQASWYLSSCKQISSVRQQGNKRACYSLLTFSLYPSGGRERHACTRTSTQSSDFWVNFTLQAEWKHVWICSIRNRLSCYVSICMSEDNCIKQYVTVETHVAPQIIPDT